MLVLLISDSPMPTGGSCSCELKTSAMKTFGQCEACNAVRRLMPVKIQFDHCIENFDDRHIVTQRAAAAITVGTCTCKRYKAGTYHTPDADCTPRKQQIQTHDGAKSAQILTVNHNNPSCLPLMARKSLFVDGSSRCTSLTRQAPRSTTIALHRTTGNPSSPLA